MDVDRSKQEARRRSSNAAVAPFTVAWYAKASLCMHPSVRFVCIPNASMCARPWLATNGGRTFRLRDPFWCDFYIRSWLPLLPDPDVCNAVASMFIPVVALHKYIRFIAFHHLSPSIPHVPLDRHRVFLFPFFPSKALVWGDGVIGMESGAKWGDPKTETEQSTFRNPNDSWSRCNPREGPIIHVRWRTMRLVWDRTHGKKRTT